MDASPVFSMRLDLGLTVETVLAAAATVGRQLACDLRPEEDGELGGIYFAYRPAALPEAGLAGVRVRANAVPGIGWSMPERPDLPFLAEIELISPSLLDLGRLAAIIDQASAAKAHIAGYVIAELPSSQRPRLLWRAHAVEFASDRAARPRWRPGRRARPRPPGADDAPAAPVLLCQVTFGCPAGELDSITGQIEAMLDVALEHATDEAIGGAYLEYRRPGAPAGALSSVLVRSNQLDQWTWLFPARQEHPHLLDLTLSTANLLELGRIAATVEAQASGAFPVIAYHVVGDLVRDRIPRLLGRAFAAAEATPLALRGPRLPS